jgi:hypothetical protein
MDPPPQHRMHQRAAGARAESTRARGDHARRVMQCTGSAMWAVFVLIMGRRSRPGRLHPLSVVSAMGRCWPKGTVSFSIFVQI